MKVAQIYTGFSLGIKPQPGETIAADGKVLRGSYMVEADNPHQEPHPAIMLVSAYIVERGLILEPYEVDSKTNEITALPEFIKSMALEGVVFAFDAISTQKKLVSSSLIPIITTWAHSRAISVVCSKKCKRTLPRVRPTKKSTRDMVALRSGLLVLLCPQLIFATGLACKL